MKLLGYVQSRLIYRAWYYFRQGYSTYLTFILGYVSTFVTVYYLAIKDMPYLLNIFPHFSVFLVIGTVIGVPLSVAVGWLHLKRTRAWTAEVDIGVEANPYLYKLPPGHAKEVNTPAILVQLRILRRIAEANGLLEDSDRAELDELQKKLLTLLEGGHVGSPRRRMDF